MKRKLISVCILCLLFTSCNDKNNVVEAEQTISFSQSSINQETLPVASETISFSDVDMDVEISYASEPIFLGSNIDVCNIYRAEYTLSPLTIENHIGADWNRLYDFSWNGIFDQDNYDGSIESIIQIISSCECTDSGDIAFTFPNSCFVDALEENLDSQESSLIIHNELVDNIPVCGAFEYITTDVYTWPNYIDTSIYFPVDHVLLTNGNQILVSSSGSFSNMMIVQEDVPLISDDLIYESVESYINHTANMNLMESAYIWGVRLMYIPLVEYSIEQNNHIGYRYMDYQNIEADVYLLPVWTVYYVGEYHNDCQMYVCFINAINGNPLYSDEYSIYDSVFLIGGM